MRDFKLKVQKGGYIMAVNLSRKLSNHQWKLKQGLHLLVTCPTLDAIFFDSINWINTNDCRDTNDLGHKWPLGLLGHNIGTQCWDTISGHNVRTQCQGTMLGHNVRIQCLNTMSEHNVRTLCRVTMLGHYVGTLCQGTMTRDNVGTQCWVIITKKWCKKVINTEKAKCFRPTDRPTAKRVVESRARD